MPQAPRASVRALALTIGAAAVLTAICIGWLDALLARALSPWQPWPFWGELLWLLELVSGLTVSRWTFAVALPLAMLVALAVPNWRHLAAPLWLLSLVHLTAKLLTNPIKDATGRLRPSEWLARGGDMFFVDGGIAFPSGHVTHLLTLTLPLAVVAPRLGRPLLVLPFLIAVCRVAVNAHFLSDVLGAVVWVGVITLLMIHVPGLSETKLVATKSD